MISIVKIGLTLFAIASIDINCSHGYIGGRISNGRENLKTISEWKTVDFSFPSENLRLESIRRGNFVDGRAVPIDVDVHYKGYLSL